MGKLFFKMFNNIRNKKGVTMIFGLVIIVFAVLFTGFLIDTGMSFYVRAHFQTITDAASAAGAVYGGEAYHSPDDGVPLVRIRREMANSKATQVIQANEAFLPARERVRIERVTYNPDGEIINGRRMTHLEQYYASQDDANPSAHFTVRLAGRYFTLLFGRSFFGDTLSVNLSSDARTTVELDR